jgi:hypothetical protein
MQPDHELFPGENGHNGHRPDDPNDGQFTNKAKTLVRLVAGGFFVVGILDLLACWFEAHKDHANLSIGRALVSCIPLVIGVWILIKTSALAQRIEDWLEQ